ncbi:hypothetical protein T3H00_02120 [Pseudomonas fluorescens]|jgi:hypothetical protein|uniref:hypothetical protein n=1 Tax=Pseudomonas TaxID=286 RepID=UPI001A91CC45|nr:MULTISPECIES: hypothetical protein [Pseudomonas]MDZ5431463.1 hypothetical protein [Pseudomonas fluorescens]
MSNAELIVGSLGGLVLLGLFICIGIALYYGYTQGDQLCSYFKNSRSSITSATHRNSGPYGKMQLVGGIAFVVTFPNIFLKQGTLDAEDMKNFPMPLRRQLIKLQWGIIGTLTSMVLLAVIETLAILKN